MNCIIEFDILKQQPEKALVLEFQDEITRLVEKFSNSGQSGGSAPYVAGAISDAVKKLCLHQPLSEITGADIEWMECGDGAYQNTRLTSVFKQGLDGLPYYLEAIVFKGQNGSCFTGNSVELKDGSTISSRQFVRLPFTPKTFYVDVIETEWADKEETEEKVGGGWWTSIVKDESQLDAVFEHYNKP